jgi:hypothetical protein
MSLQTPLFSNYGVMEACICQMGADSIYRGIKCVHYEYLPSASYWSFGEGFPQKKCTLECTDCLIYPRNMFL